MEALNIKKIELDLSKYDQATLLLESASEITNLLVQITDSHAIEDVPNTSLAATLITIRDQIDLARTNLS